MALPDVHVPETILKWIICWSHIPTGHSDGAFGLSVSMDSRYACIFCGRNRGLAIIITWMRRITTELITRATSFTVRNGMQIPMEFRVR